MALPPRAVAALALFAPLCGSCASLESDRHLAPLYSQISTAGGGTEIEALAGAAVVRRRRPGGRELEWGLRPLFLHQRLGAGVQQSEFLAPLGRVRREPREIRWRLLPLAQYRRVTHGDGTRTWSYFGLPLVYIAGFPDGRVVRAWFPFGGRIENLLTFDRLDFALWPLWMRTVREGRTATHFLFPIFRRVEGEHASGLRVWPLYGRTVLEGNYDQRFALWPLFNRQRRNLAAPPELQRLHWSVFPFFGRTEQGSFRATTVLWPFFGYSHDSRSGFRAWDGPWPLVRVQRPGQSDRARRTRFWPLYSSYDDGGLESRWYLWPLINSRSEHYAGVEREAFVVVPFWQGIRRVSEEEGESVYYKLWPVWERESGGAGRSFAFPALSPLWRTPTLDRHYAWIWQLYTRREVPRREVVREKALYGLWRREKDQDEDRAYVSALWSRRRYTSDGAELCETALLFGLLRWRSGGGHALQLLPPAFPGPGWPLERAPRSR